MKPHKNRPGLCKDECECNIQIEARLGFFQGNNFSHHINSSEKKETTPYCAYLPPFHHYSLKLEVETDGEDEQLRKWWPRGFNPMSLGNTITRGMESAVLTTWPNSGTVRVNITDDKKWHDNTYTLLFHGCQSHGIMRSSVQYVLLIPALNCLYGKQLLCLGPQA